MERVGDARRRGRRGTVADAARAERLLPLPVAPYPATIEAERTVGKSALVAYEGNRYSLPPGLEGQRVLVRRRLGAREVEIHSQAGTLVARHPLAPAGAGALARTAEHHQALEQAVLAATAQRSGPPCRRKQNRPPGPGGARGPSSAWRHGRPRGGLHLDGEQPLEERRGTELLLGCPLELARKRLRRGLEALIG
jgi:hypothetical protein